MEEKKNRFTDWQSKRDNKLKIEKQVGMEKVTKLQNLKILGGEREKER